MCVLLQDIFGKRGILALLCAVFTIPVFGLLAFSYVFPLVSTLWLGFTYSIAAVSVVHWTKFMTRERIEWPRNMKVMLTQTCIMFAPQLTLLRSHSPPSSDLVLSKHYSEQVARHNTDKCSRS